MSAEQQDTALPSEDSILAYAHGVRKNYVQQKIVDGKFPEDPSEQKNVLTALKHMSDDAMGRKRLKVEEKIADAQGAASSVIAEVLQAAAAAKGLYKADAPVAREIPQLGSEVPTPPMVEGETAVVGGSSENYETFLAKQQGGGANAAA